MDFSHISVLLGETIEELKIKEDGIYVDGTLGGGGHAYEIAKQLSVSGRLIGIDQDCNAIEAAKEKLMPYQDRITIVHSNYRNTKQVLRDAGIEKIDGMILDLGVSSFQLDTLERGFSYKYDTCLDMRMDTRQELTAEVIVNTYSEDALYRMIRDYGEDKFAKNIAKHIVREREKEPILTTGKLNDIIRAAIPAKIRAESGHPSKKTFQAIRIECNGELEVLKEAMEDMVSLLNPGGRLCIITFHSLEDRIVKNFMRNWESPCICPPNFPQCVCGRTSLGRVVTRKPIIPTSDEISRNKRSKSAKLRVFEKA